LACSPGALPFVLVVTQPPDRDSPLPVVLVVLRSHPDVAARCDGEIIRTECGELATGIHDGMPMARPIARIAHEVTPVDRAHDRLLDGDRPALASRERFEGGQPFRLGDASWP